MNTNFLLIGALIASLAYNIHYLIKIHALQLVCAPYETLYKKEQQIKQTKKLLVEYIETSSKVKPRYAKKLADYYYKAGEEFSVDPLLLAVVGRHESRYDPNAVSYKGAIGIMQIMPFWVDELTFVEYTSDLYDPETNIRAGAFILSHYINKCGGLENGLRCYYGGESTLESPRAKVVKYAERLLETYSNMESI